MSKRTDLSTRALPRVSFPWLWFVVAFGLLLCFCIGWVYLSDWYGYFGVSASELDMSLYFILSYGAEIVLFNLGVIAAIFGIVFLLRAAICYFKALLFDTTRLRLANLFSLDGFLRPGFHFAFLLYLALEQWLLWSSWNHYYQKLLPPIEFVVANCFIIPVSAILLVRMIADLLGALPRTVKRRLNLRASPRIADALVRDALALLAFFAAMIFFAAMSGMGEASEGFRSMDGGYSALPQVYLVSDQPVVGLDVFRQGCGCDPHPYKYGPLGYLAGQGDTIILVPWKSGQSFTQYPEIYRVQRSLYNPITVLQMSSNPWPVLSTPPPDGKE